MKCVYLAMCFTFGIYTIYTHFDTLSA